MGFSRREAFLIDKLLRKSVLVLLQSLLGALSVWTSKYMSHLKYCLLVFIIKIVLKYVI